MRNQSLTISNMKTVFVKAPAAVSSASSLFLFNWLLNLFQTQRKSIIKKNISITLCHKVIKSSEKHTLS